MKRRLPALYEEINTIETLRNNPKLCIEALGVWSQEEVVWTCRKHTEPYSWTTTVGYRSRGGNQPRPCPECRRLQKRQEKQATLLIKGCSSERLQFVRGEYKQPGDFEDLPLYSTRKLPWSCGGCGFEWQARLASRLLRNNNCPQCFSKTSRNELRMRRALEDLGIGFKTDYKVGCVIQRPLKVDMFVEAGVLHRFPLAIEVDGEFHFRGDPKALHRDMTLDAYCRDHGIHLLRVHHKTPLDYRMIMADFCEHLQESGDRILHCFVK